MESNAIVTQTERLPATENLADLKFIESNLEFVDQVLRRGTYHDTTIENYERKVRHFLEFGGSIPCDPGVLLSYASHLIREGWQVETVRHHLDAVRWKHREEDHPDPNSSQLKSFLKIAKVKVYKPLRQAKPLRPDLLKRLIDVPEGSDLMAYRDAAMFAIGWGCALRSSEIVALCFEDLEFSDERGLVVTIRRSKTDQAGAGQYTHLPADDPHGILTTMKRWLEMVPYRQGFIFPRLNTTRHHNRFPDMLDDDGVPYMARGVITNTVRNRLRARLEAIGVAVDGYSPHSLRAGFATSLSEEGASLVDIQRQTRHRSIASLMVYIRDGDMVRQNPLRIYKEKEEVS